MTTIENKIDYSDLMYRSLSEFHSQDPENEIHVYYRGSVKHLSKKFIKTHHKKISSISKKLGFNSLVTFHHEVGSETTIHNRPRLSYLLRLIEEGQIKNLYVENTDRLSGNQQDWNYIRRILIENKVNLFVGDGTNYELDDPMDDFIFGIMKELSKFEESLREEKSRKGKS